MTQPYLSIVQEWFNCVLLQTDYHVTAKDVSNQLNIVVTDDGITSDNYILWCLEQ